MTERWKEIYFTARDGLRLHTRLYGTRKSSRRAALCLPGLSRNHRDFHALALRLSDPTRHRRPVYTFDYRGRGLSEHDPDWRNYSPYIEALDVLDFMSRERLHDVALIGTSRGGLLAMIMATIRPTSIGVTVLNDIGPVIERDGLARIVGYVGKVPTPNDWSEATALVRSMNERDFPNHSSEEWEAVARQQFNDENGAPSPAYDKALAKSISAVNMEAGLPELWPQFRALARNPVMVIRGANSDILGRETVERMKALAPHLEAIEVADEGHAPLLRDASTLDAIENFLIMTDPSAGPAATVYEMAP